MSASNIMSALTNVDPNVIIACLALLIATVLYGESRTDIGAAPQTSPTSTLTQSTLPLHSTPLHSIAVVSTVSETKDKKVYPYMMGMATGVPKYKVAQVSLALTWAQLPKPHPLPHSPNTNPFHYSPTHRVMP
jgi:hypothetical protein